ncbi:hypothetical protein ACOSQ3_006763 [Xanthoceras sorbifolium]
MTGQTAIIESSNLCPEQQEQTGRLYIGEHLDSTDFTFYMVIFVKPISQATSSFLFNKFLTSKKGVSNSQLQLGKIVRIWFGMVLCTIFCVVSWRVEVHRLQIVDRERNIFWLALHYCLLGLMQDSGVNGLDEFMISELPKSLNNYASTMIGFVVDRIGNFCSTPRPDPAGPTRGALLGLSKLFQNFILHFKNHCEPIKQFRNPFQSHLGKYNFQLMILSFLNMCYYYPISVIYILIRYARSDMVERDHITINQ